MSEPIISVQNLSKRYLVGHEVERERYTALRDVLMRNVRGLARSTRDLLQGRPIRPPGQVEEFWALKDVSFEINRGDAIGIIGRNGAGKSTLLKILSRITEPTKGRIELNGRVASLLEVGTGFHPELTGRENIFLNGAILGMTRAEIKRKFDEIVAFAEVEKFLDTPVKRYSSGMYVRLAFAVAAHLEPEILIVDEVLAVGDAQFQKKCLGKMKDVSAKEGRTVLFVSHNTGAILSLCSKTILLKGGSIQMQGEPGAVVAHYLRDGATHSEVKWTEAECPGDEVVKLRGVSIIDHQGHLTTTVDMESPFEVEMDYEILQPASGLHLGFRMSSADGTPVLTTGDLDGSSTDDATRAPGRYLARCVMPGGLLNSQTYYFSFGAHVPGVKVHYFVESAIELTVARTHPRGSTVEDNRQGVISPVLPWKVSKQS